MKNFKFFLLGITCLSVFASCNQDEDSTLTTETIAIANRASGTVSLVNAMTDELDATIAIDGSAPMYLNYVSQTDKLYVGDRNNNAIHVINPDTKEVESMIKVGNGVFHMWAGGNGKQLWVNNDIDKTVSVIDLMTNEVVKTIQLMNKPHDVFVTEDGTMAYVSAFVGDESVADVVYAFNTTTFEKIAEMSVGEDPHLFHVAKNNKLYVPNQSGTLYILDGKSLKMDSKLELPGAHGVFADYNDNYLYVTGLPDQKLYTVDISTGMLLETVDATTAIPHNIAVSPKSDKVYVSHSGGTADQLSIYMSKDGKLEAKKNLTIGKNPFGITSYTRGGIKVNIDTK